MRSLVATGLGVGLLAVAAGPNLQADTRGKPYTADQLLARSAAVFIGEVVETKAFPEHNRTVPTRVRMLLGIKGEAARGERSVTPKDPGAHVYYDQEFSQAAKGRLGVFYVGEAGRPDVLLGYREIPSGGGPK